MDRKFYEQPTIQILRLDSEVWFVLDTPSVDTDQEGGTGGDGDLGWED